MTKRLLRLFPILGLVAIVSAAAFLATAAQAKEPLQLSGDNVYRYDHSDSVALRNSEQNVNRGTRLAGGGCEFETYLETTQEGPAKASRFLSANFDTCEAIVETGEVRPEDLDRLTRDDPGPDTPANAFAAQSGPIYQAKFKTWWDDPVEITMNGLKSYLKWTVDSDKVWYYSGSCHHWKSLGWKDKGGTCDNAYLTGQRAVEQRATRTFTNNVFNCVIGQYTKVEYNKNLAGGRVDGGLYGRSVSRASGACAFLLHKHTLLYS